MSLAPAARRLGVPCLFCRPLVMRPRLPAQRLQSRAASGQGDSSDQSNPILEEYLRKHGKTSSAQPAERPVGRPMPATGDISASSIFGDAERTNQFYETEPKASESGSGQITIGDKARDPENLRRLLDVAPRARLNWERKKVIQMVRNGGRLTKQEWVKRTEREHLKKSHMLKTSIKKLGMLARQITGKTIDDAITQMRFSKKKVAIEVAKELERARDEAIVVRGMGLGRVDTSNLAESGEDATRTGVDIQLKDGSKYTVKDHSQIYIDQAWVGRGTYGKLPDYRARGRMFIMRTPWTSLSLVLKEDQTRVREHVEREAKRRRKTVEKPWVHLPDRPVQWQRQWYTF